MGRKSTAKSQTRSSSANSASPPPDEPKRAFSPLLAVALIVVAAVVGIFVATRSAQTTPPASQSAADTPAPVPPPADEPPPHAKFGPHKQDRLPPLPFEPMPARPMDVVRASYTFAAEHPEILGYVPCYCGCERSGHRGNDDCFVAARDARGDITQWEPHGMT